jgi:hypothetical protein
MKKLITANLADSSIIQSLVTVYKNSKNSKVQTSVVNALQAVENETSQGRSALLYEVTSAIAKSGNKEADGNQEGTINAQEDQVSTGICAMGGRTDIVPCKRCR